MSAVFNPADILRASMDLPAGVTMRMLNTETGQHADLLDTGEIRTSAGALVPPKPPLTVTDADALPPTPSEAEILAVLALPLDARFALCADRGPGWTVHPTQPQAVPRLRPCAPSLLPDTVGAWLPAGIDGIVDLVANALDVGRRPAMHTICAEVNANVTIRLAALRVLGRVWR